LSKISNEIIQSDALLRAAEELPQRGTSEGVVSNRVGPLLMAIASVCMRLTDQSGTADILGVAALAALTLSIQRVPFQVAPRVVSRGDRLSRRSGSSVPVR
jgi:hypothetical protein